MGLSGRKTKQHIGADPRNLSWADDAAKFGQAYLSKMGWDPSQGLGLNGEGRTSHVKVAQKLNLLGVGAGAQQQGPDGVAWRQNRDYELLLKRLNEISKEGDEESSSAEAKEEDGRKRKRVSDDGLDTKDEKKNKKKKEKKEKKDKEEKREKKRQEDKEEDKEGKGVEEGKAGLDCPTVAVVKAPIPRPMAHRARFLRSKQLASRSSTAIAEILGISASATPSSFSPSASATPFPTELDVISSIPGQELTIATKSVADYFKDKLAARVLARSGVSSPVPLTSLSAVAMTDNVDQDSPRAGMGSGSPRLTLTEPLDSPQRGIGSGVKFGGLMGDFSAAIETSAKVSAPPLSHGGRVSDEDRTESKKKDKKKKGRGKEKDEKLSLDGTSTKDSCVLTTSIGADSSEITQKEDTRRERKEKKRERRRRKEETL